MAELVIYAKGDRQKTNICRLMAGLVRHLLSSKLSVFNIDAASNLQHPDNRLVPSACHFSASLGYSLFLDNIESVQPTYVTLNER